MGLSTSPKIAYIMSRFPHLPETFILREMNELRSLGWDVVLYPLIRQKPEVIHPEAEPWLEEIHALPFLSPGIAAANTGFALRHPRQYLELWREIVQGHLSSPKFLLRAAALFPKAISASRKMQAEGVRHIHAHYATHPALFAWLIHRLTGIPYSITVHAHDIFVDTTMLAPKVQAAEFVVAISDYNRRHLAGLLGPEVLEKTYVIHCGVNPELYQLKNGRVEDTLKILNVGSLQPYKGQRWLIEACARLLAQSVPFHCQIIGEGEERPNLEQEIRSRGLADHITLVGAQTEDQVAQAMASASCYVQPSVVEPNGKMEGIPVAIMEAFASGLPVVATNISGIPELVRDGETGCLVPPEDGEALAQALAKLHREPERAKQMGQNGRELVLQEFNLRKNVSSLSNLFSKALERNN